MFSLILDFLGEPWSVILEDAAKFMPRIESSDFFFSLDESVIIFKLLIFPLVFAFSEDGWTGNRWMQCTNSCYFYRVECLDIIFMLLRFYIHLFLIILGTLKSPKLLLLILDNCNWHRFMISYFQGIFIHLWYYYQRKPTLTSYCFCPIIKTSLVIDLWHWLSPREFDLIHRRNDENAMVSNLFSEWLNFIHIPE